MLMQVLEIIHGGSTYRFHIPSAGQYPGLNYSALSAIVQKGNKEIQA
ncbi:MAG: hypothetical protein HY513_02070 [Candidatus Aenigmarchaeota archaeon]|nr:hypothetical protein [Candidatus Aenigmarchaeota archaeon]